MFPSLQAKLHRYSELETLLQDQAVLTDPARLTTYQREMGGLSKVALKVRTFNSLLEEIATTQALAQDSDPETREYAQAELESLNARRAPLQQELEDMVLAGDSLTRGSLIMEIRAGTGGEEAALFARDLYDMYTKLCTRRGWKTEVIEFSPADMGGVKEVVFSITGEGAYRELQFESGGHRVQRVPRDRDAGARAHQHGHGGRAPRGDGRRGRNQGRGPAD